MSDSYKNTITQFLNPDGISSYPGPQYFFNNAPQTFHNALQQCILDQISLDDLFTSICQESPLINEIVPFIIFSGKLSSIKHSHFQFFLLTNSHTLIRYDPSQNQEYVVLDHIQELDFKSEKSIKMSETPKRHIIIYTESSGEPLFTLFKEFINNTSISNTFELFMRSLSLLEAPLVPFPSLRDYIRRLFLQPDFIPVRSLYFLPVQSTVKRSLANSIIIFHSFKKDLFYFMHYITSTYFLDPPEPSKLLRSDTLLTNCFASLRDIYVERFFKLLSEYFEYEIKTAQTTTEILSKFLDVIETQSIPGILRWLCWLLYDETRHAFPEGDAPYFAVSGFFFLRGLGPQLTAIEDPVIRKKCSIVSKLFNYSNQPEIEVFVPRFKEALDKISLTIDDVFEVFPPLPDERELQAADEMLNILYENNKIILDWIHEQKPIGMHPIKWFISIQLELEKEKMGLNNQNDPK